MSQMFVIDAKGLVAIAIIFHDKLTQSALYQMLESPRSISDKYLTTETSIMTAFSMVADFKEPKLTDALMRVVRYFFDLAVPSFSLETKPKAQIYQVYGDFVQGHGTTVPSYVLDTCFVAKKIYPGSQIIGMHTDFYSANNITVHPP